MTIRSLAEVGLCLTALQEGMDPAAPPEEKLTVIESTAIAILDSEFAEHPPGVLEAYLMAYLRLKELELGVCLPLSTDP